MGQSKSESLLEASVNSIVAMGYAVLIYTVWYDWTPMEGLQLTVIFAVLGLVRVFIIRRIAEFISNKRDGA